MSSPLGKYAAATAAIASIGIIAGYLLSEFLVGAGILAVRPDGLKEIALIAVGAVFGSAVAVNGWKQPVDVAHSRIDKLEASIGTSTHS